jgi:hypothetical protein
VGSLGSPPSSVRRLNDADIEYICELDIGYDKGRIELLPEILRDWYEHEFAEHLQAEDYSQYSARKKRLNAASKALLAAVAAIKSIEDGDVEFLAVHMARSRVRGGQAFHDRVGRLTADLRRTAAFLTRITDAAAKADFGRGRSTTWSLLVMCDLAAMYRYVTRRKPARSEGGFDAGRFAEFSEAVWIRILGEDSGWAAALKKWDAGSDEEKERSAFIANLYLRHPDWRVSGG